MKFLEVVTTLSIYQGIGKTLGLMTQDTVANKESKHSEGVYSMLYLNTSPSSVSNSVFVS